MVFSSFVFLGIFLSVTLALYFIVKNRAWRNAVLLIASLFFYAWGEPVWIIALFVVSLVDYIAALAIEKIGKGQNKRTVLIVALVVNLGVLFVFKYLSLFVNTIDLIPFIAIPDPQIALPIGISFYTFQSMSYVIDVYRGKVQAQHAYNKLLLYISMFPQLVAGPIVRYSDISKMIDGRVETAAGFARGTLRFSIGFAKKVLLANFAAQVATSLLADGLSDLSAAGAWLGLLMFAFQIYFDFSGYSDMAIGLGRIFGFEYKENFNYPYISRSITEFWRRWYISLSSFFRDYVYIPMGGNRRHQYLNIAVVWALTGIWHGASWNFMLWGLYYGLLLVVEKKLLKFDCDISRIPIMSTLLTMLFVLFGWSLFYYTDISQLGVFLTSLIGLGDTSIALTATELTSVSGVFYLIPVMVIACTPLPARLAGRIFKENNLGFILRFCLAMVLMIISFVVLVNQGYNPFIYFRF